MSSDSAASPSSPRPHDAHDIDDTPDFVRPYDAPPDALHADPPDSPSLEPEPNGLTFARVRKRSNDHVPVPDGERLRPHPAPGRRASLESASTPDDTPSVQGSIISSPSLASHRPHRPTSLQPFDRRFSSRLSPSPNTTPRGPSPIFLSTHSRQSSVSSNLLFNHPPEDEGTSTPQAPWEVVRWTKLKKITGQLFSEVGKRNFGRPTCLNVAATLVIGTSKGFILVFDYQQVLKSIIGPGTKAVECGAVTALALSADHSTVAGGHATGHIFTWELSKPAKPFLHILPLDRAGLDDRISDGHVFDVAILHIGFLGTRHTALVSADHGGMAFSHLATRGLGALARTVKTTRILGRYPLHPKSQEKPKKPSSVLAFAPLPLGNVEQPTDEMGLTALLTPYLLVIVSTTPLAQTQHKAPRPKEIEPHSALSGCLAWFPAVKLKNPSGDPSKAVSKTKLVYCWSNVLTILDIECIAAPPMEREKPTELQFRPRSRWRAEEAIVAVQWLSRSVLGVLTISQRLLILEDNTLRTTDSFDLLHKHIYHSDLFSNQLKPIVEHHNEEDTTMHGVVADAFYMSFRAYKGRMFLLGFNDVAIGTLSNWADRLLALMEDGDFIAAIGLATSYYVGDADKLTVGLPEDDNSRHALVQEKLLDMISASLKYAFSREDPDEENREQRLQELAEVCFTGLLHMKEMDFLFEDVYEAYEQGSAEQSFFETLEPYILDEEIIEMPPDVLKDLITFYASNGRGTRLEEMICHLRTHTMDLNQVTMLCEQYVLYEALIYVWTRAIGDYITPLTRILGLVKMVGFDMDMKENVYITSAKKIFPYLAYTFTGRTYPEGTFLNVDQAYAAKKEVYQYLFSGKNLEWPPGSGDVFLTRSDNTPEPPFPYLYLALEFDASSFMSMLNEAFEDSFLNEQVANGTHTNGTRQNTFTPTRQYIINILFGIMTPQNFGPGDIIYFYMFVARNLPKYPQHIMLPGTSLHQILVGLCDYPTDIIKEDCQLSVEYLLSVYQPPNTQDLVPLFEQAGFHRVLKSVYRAARQYGKLLEAYFDDEEDADAVFSCISDLLRPSKGLLPKQASEVKAIILERAQDLADRNASRTATTLKQHALDLLEPVLDRLHESDTLFRYLQALIEPECVGLTSRTQTEHALTIDENLPPGFVERYVELMCSYDSVHVANFVGRLKSGDLRLEPVLPALESSGVIDAAVILMARDGLVQDAMSRLVKHLDTLETALTGLIGAAAETPDVANTEEAVHDLLEDIHKYIKVGIWLCQGQTRASTQKSSPKSVYGDISESDLSLDELLWLDLIDVVVKLMQQTSSSIVNSAPDSIDTPYITTHLRTSIQQTFSALLAITTIPTSTTSAPPTTIPQSNPSFLRILRTFLTRASSTYSPTLSNLRTVLTEMFDAYTFESNLLSLANSFLDKESFVHVSHVTARRCRGWRPRGQACEGCGGRAWGPGAGSRVWEAWEKRESERLKGEMERRSSVKGKERRDVSEDEADIEDKGPLVVFACRHLWHRSCVEGSFGALRCGVCK